PHPVELRLQPGRPERADHERELGELDLGEQRRQSSDLRGHLRRAGGHRLRFGERRPEAQRDHLFAGGHPMVYGDHVPAFGQLAERDAVRGLRGAGLRGAVRHPLHLRAGPDGLRRGRGDLPSANHERWWWWWWWCWWWLQPGSPPPHRLPV